MPQGEQIKTLDDLCRAARDRRVVVGWGPICRPRPAVFVLNMIGSTIWMLIGRGMFIYEKPERKADES